MVYEPDNVLKAIIKTEVPTVMCTEKLYIKVKKIKIMIPPPDPKNSVIKLIKPLHKKSAKIFLSEQFKYCLINFFQHLSLF